jgi:hypothetical protein
MNTNLQKNTYLILLVIGVLAVSLVLLNDLFQGKVIDYRYNELFGLLFGGLYVITCLILITLRKQKVFQKINFLSTKVYLFEVILVLILIGSLLGTGNYLYKCYHYEPSVQKWSIGIYSSNSSEPLNFDNDPRVNNPVLTCDDVNDVAADFVADPFLVSNNGSYFLFFEIMNKTNSQGDIAVATSNDGYNWSYSRIVLDEPFHLSYPYVFKWNNTWYMIPESGEEKDIRLYKSNNFPYNWSFEKELVKGDAFVDNSIFNYNNTWWLFTQTPAQKSSIADSLLRLITRNNSQKNSNVLRLYYSNDLKGPWIEHPKSPVVKGDANITRLGGRVIIFDNRIIRYAQDCDPYYGNQVWALEIEKLSKEEFKEIKVGNKPILKGYDNWNTMGMHQLSPYQVNNTFWIAAVDGY